LLQIAPGGSLGRLIVWSEGAFNKLQKMYGNYRTGAPMKKGYTLPRHQMTNADLARLINSNEVQVSLNPVKEPPRHKSQAKNPLKNHSVMCRLNPAAASMRRTATRELIKGTKEFEKVQDRKRKREEEAKDSRKKSRLYKKTVMAAFEGARDS